MIKVLAIACVTVPVIAVSAIAQQPAFKRTVLRSIDYPAGYTTVTVIVEIAPGACTGRHTHPGIDSGYVMQGDFVLKIDGKPEQTLKAGDTYETSPQIPHDACSVSGNKLIDTFVVEKGKPLASPRPDPAQNEVSVRFGSEATNSRCPCDVRFSNRPFEVKRFQTIHRHSFDVARGLALLSGLGTRALPSWDSRRGGTIFSAALPSDERRVQAEMRTHLIHRPARDINPPLGGARVFSYRN